MILNAFESHCVTHAWTYFETCFHIKNIYKKIKYLIKSYFKIFKKMWLQKNYMNHYVVYKK